MILFDGFLGQLAIALILFAVLFLAVFIFIGVYAEKKEKKKQQEENKKRKAELKASGKKELNINALDKITDAFVNAIKSSTAVSSAAVDVVSTFAEKVLYKPYARWSKPGSMSTHESKGDINGK